MFTKKADAAVRVCLAYPNRYAVAMGNLGFHAVYELCDQFPGVVCERAFLPDDDNAPTPVLRSLESNRPLTDFDIIAFSISFEVDYWHVARLLSLARIPVRSAQRSGHPLIVAGGPATFLNPEPIADFIDLFLIGEAEEMLPEFLALYCEAHAAGVERDHGLRQAAERVAGAYVPAFYAPRFDGPVTVGLDYAGPGSPMVERRLVWDLNRFATTSRVLTDEAVFGDMVMVEASRGCQWGCRFCAAGYMYRPIRTRGVEQLAASVRAGLAERQTIGLVGAEMASVSGVDVLTEIAADAGGRLSPSSLKADCVTPRLAAALVRNQNRSVTIAPEAGSERMRRVINKNLTEADILRATELLVGEGVRDLKIYSMFGLPTEEIDDVLAIADLTLKLRTQLCEAGRARGRVGKIIVSLNPFVPKPWTPFQWEPMDTLPCLKFKIQQLRKALGKVPNVKLDIESPREAYFQTLLSRGDRRLGVVLEAIDAADGDWWHVLRRWQRGEFAALPHPDGFVHRRYGDAERMPWDFIDHRIAKSYLWVERRKALAARQTPPCDTTTCTSCAAC
ncbi:MAG TPA: radical SAM protein [Candidatus Binatia bacterium]|nr:radical SAM protein [Candidatus Binatia bacterium]